jgi:putative ABC transport system substrate-binding protein
MLGVANDPVYKARVSAFTQALADLGWTDGRNVRVDVRWGGDDTNRIRALAQELVGLQPDVILANGTSATVALQRETRTIPIVFANVSDPVGSGFVAGLPRPGGNLTGFGSMEAGMAGKSLQLLTEIAPGVKRVAILFNPDTAPSGGSYFLTAFEAAARSLKIVPITALVHSAVEIETVITSLGHELGGGFVVLPDGFVALHRALIILLAARNNVPAVYQLSAFGRRVAFLRTRLRGHSSSRGLLCRSHSARREAGGATRSAADQVRVGCKPQDRHVAWTYGAPINSAKRR